MQKIIMAAPGCPVREKELKRVLRLITISECEHLSRFLVKSGNIEKTA
jgi:hypothetical protein